MKIAEALREIKSIKGKLSRTWALIEENSYFVQDKETPEFKAEDMLKEAEGLTDELRKLKMRVQTANMSVKVEGELLAEAIIRLGDLRGEVAKREQIFRARPENRYFHEEEVVYETAVSEKEQVVVIERIGKEIEDLDNAIQKANWANDLID